MREFSSNGAVSLYDDNTNKANNPNRRIISIIDSVFFLKVMHGSLNTF